MRDTPTSCGLLLQHLRCVNRESTAKIAIMALGACDDGALLGIVGRQ